jgi:hypothetical protein
MVFIVEGNISVTLNKNSFSDIFLFRFFYFDVKNAFLN